jgi:hypothetical protein
MAKNETFTISKKGQDPISVTYPFPENLEDPRWQEVVNDYPQDVHELAVSQFRVRLQAAGRSQYDDGAEAVQSAVGEYVYGRRQAGPRKSRARLSKDAVKKAKFTKEQLAALAEAGIQVEGTED